jgi:outer membrane protein OmpA-like peptidoglycan-associated protein
MMTASKATALATAALLALSLAGCGGGNEQAASEQATIDPAPGAAGQAGGMGEAGGGIGTAGTAATTSQALTGYLGETGADATGRSFPLEQVTFASGASTLDAAGQSALSEVAAVLKQHPNAAVTITSYADPQGDAAANKKLAAARAVAVKNALSSTGIPASRLMTNVVGETGNAPLPENRRVELLVKRG